MEFVQNALKKDYSWIPQLDLMEWKAHYSKLKSQPDEVYRFGWQNPINDPSLMYDLLTSTSPHDFTGWKNKNDDQWVDKLRKEVRLAKRGAIFSELEKILWNEAPVVPLLHPVLRFAVSKRVLGFRANPFGVIPFRELHLTENQTRTESKTD